MVRLYSKVTKLTDSLINFFSILLSNYLIYAHRQPFCVRYSIFAFRQRKGTLNKCFSIASIMFLVSGKWAFSFVQIS